MVECEGSCGSFSVKLFAIFLIVVCQSSCKDDVAPVAMEKISPPAPVIPNSEVECGAAGGLWIFQGHGKPEMSCCLIYSKSRGRRCFDSADCDGLCVMKNGSPQCSEFLTSELEKLQVYEGGRVALEVYGWNPPCISNDGARYPSNHYIYDALGERLIRYELSDGSDKDRSDTTQQHE